MVGKKTLTVERVDLHQLPAPRVIDPNESKKLQVTRGDLHANAIALVHW